MVSTDVTAFQLSPAEHQVQLRRAVIASTIGTAIEWYDFFLYSTVTGLVFAKLFFPNSDPWVGTLEAFAIYAVGFVARPIGAAIFGHYGDRIGRKSTLIATLLLMGLATFAVALVPTYAAIGIWGAVILTILRFIQGIGVGGEWGGSVLMSMEWARTNMPAASSPPGRSSACRAGCSSPISPCSRSARCPASNSWRGAGGCRSCSASSWSWSASTSVSASSRRRSSKLVAESKVERTPILEVIKRHPKEIILSAFARMAEQAPFYIFTAFIFSYGTDPARLARLPADRGARGVGLVVLHRSRSSAICPIASGARACT